MADQDNTDAPASPEIGGVSSDSILDKIDLSLLEDSLAKTPWERMLANDDPLHCEPLFQFGQGAEKGAALSSFPVQVRHEAELALRR